jgi:regulator of nonsense transcripts 2
VTREIVELPPMQSFIQHLLHDVLMKRTLDKVLKLLRKLHWEDEEVGIRHLPRLHTLTCLEVYDYLMKSFIEIWEIKFGNIPFIAALVYDLQRYHPEFGIAIVDQVMEDIRIGMEVSLLLPLRAMLILCRKTSSNTIKGESRP